MRTTYERRTAENPRDLVYFEGRVPVPAVWTVRVWRCPLWHDVTHHCYMVQASEQRTGARVPSAPRRYATLARARKDAQHLFAVVTGAMVVEPWSPDWTDSPSSSSKSRDVERDGFEAVDCRQRHSGFG